MDDRFTVDLPEQVGLEYQLAGVGARFAAAIIDSALQLVLMGAGAALALILATTAQNIPPTLVDVSAWWGALPTLAQGITLLWLFALFWGYHILFELGWEGQTPGKRALGLRALRADGLPMGAAESALRNLLRPVDLLPIFYGVGGVSMALTPLRQRMGDLAAGTVVVQDALITADTPAPEAQWAELDALLTRGAHALSPTEIGRLTALHRRAAAQLAAAGALGLSDAARWALRARVAQGRRILYQPPRRGLVVSIARFYGERLPRLIRLHRGLVALCVALLIGPMAITWQAGRADPARAYAMATPAQRTNARHYVGGWEEGRAADEGAAAAAFYITNNTSVALRAFAGGATLGTLTVWSLVYNGVQLGTTLALVESMGATEHLAAFISVHGPIELMAIVMAAAGGLILAWALLRPGARTRSESLARRAPDALGLAVGSATLLAIAGLLEGLVSPSALPPHIKQLIGALTVAILGLYVAGAGRSAREVPDEGR